MDAIKILNIEDKRRSMKKYFYLNMGSKDNLRPDCIKCHKKAKKIGYNRKIAPESIHG